MCLQQSILLINNMENSVIIITISGPQFSKQSFQTICPVIVSLADPCQIDHVSAELLFFAKEDHGPWVKDLTSVMGGGGRGMRGMGRQYAEAGGPPPPPPSGVEKKNFRGVI